MGRFSKLGAAVTVQEAVDLVKRHLKLDHVRLALGEGCNTGTLQNPAAQPTANTLISCLFPVRPKKINCLFPVTVRKKIG